MDIDFIARDGGGLSAEEIRAALERSLAGRALKKVLIIPPDYTRLHSNAGFITNVYYHLLTGRGAEVDILPALGTHEPVTRAQAAELAGRLEDVYLLDGDDLTYEVEDNVVACYHLVKGMEFDAVAVVWPDCEDTADERRRLYTACSRALHAVALCRDYRPAQP